MLKILDQEKSLSKKQRFEAEAKERFDTYWAHPPPLNAVDKLRLKRTWDLIKCVEGVKAIDLGCGSGELALKLQRNGLDVTALDVSSKALEIVKRKGVHGIWGCLPYLTLPDTSFDLVVCTDVIAELEVPLYRLLLSELSLLVKREGRVVISTSLDVGSIDALGKFRSLIESEFTILKRVYSSHRLFPRSQKFLHILENLSEILWGDGAITHVIFLCQKKPLLH